MLPCNLLHLKLAKPQPKPSAPACQFEKPYDRCPIPFIFAAGDKHLYTVLEQQQAQIAQGHLMGSDHTYVIPQAGAGGPERRPQGGAARR